MRAAKKVRVGHDGMVKGSMRNCLCVCGSGKKLKRCCLQKDGKLSKKAQRIIDRLKKKIKGAEKPNIFSLSKFLNFANNLGVFSQASGLKDARSCPEYSPLEIFIWVFLMCTLRLSGLYPAQNFFAVMINLRSFPIDLYYGIHALSAKRKAVGSCLRTLSVHMVRELLYFSWMRILKMIGQNMFKLVCFDGVEVSQSKRLHCPLCHKRYNQDEELVGCYHFFVCSQVVLGPIKLILDFEPVRPGEGEATAAKRLYARLYEKFKGRFTETIVLDGYYKAEFVKEIREIEKKETKKTWIIIKTKQESLEIIQDTEHLLEFVSTPTISSFDSKRGCSYKIWDTAEQMEWRGLKRLRVVKVYEKYISKIHRKKEEETFWCITDIPAYMHDCTTIWDYAHRRWVIENNGFRELKTFWHADHVYKHDANAVEAMLLIFSIAYNVFHAWRWHKFSESKTIKNEEKTTTIIEIVEAITTFFKKNSKAVLEVLYGIITQQFFKNKHGYDTS